MHDREAVGAEVCDEITGRRGTAQSGSHLPQKFVAALPLLPSALARTGGTPTRKIKAAVTRCDENIR